MKGRLSYLSILFAGILVALLLPMAACTSAPTMMPTPTPTPMPTPQYMIMTMSMAGAGDYLVDGKGMTMYYFTKDTAGKSSATAPIIANWPIFYATSVVVPSNLNASDFGTITGFGGQMQTTYKGWPLYYYIKDKAKGDTVGQGVGGVWFVVNPATTPAAP
jgi:predicted lipoprotein with Yx(FWY)xxD motif